MKVLYLLNESPFYMQMAWFSIQTLRKYNKNIKVEILYVCDKQKDNRYSPVLFDFGIENFTKESFVESTKIFDVDFNFVHDIDLKEEKGYHPLHRIAFQNVDDDQILLLDADTFIFGDLSPFFNALNYHDLVADMNEWGRWGNTFPYQGFNFCPFNSGVVLFNKGLLREYGKQVYDLSMAVKGNEHPVGKWMEDYERCEGSNGKGGREEIAFTLFVLDNKINYRLSTFREIQTTRRFMDCLIHHTQTPNYIRFWKKYFSSGDFKSNIKLNQKLFGLKTKYIHEKEK